jgi:hypothetical protein
MFQNISKKYIDFNICQREKKNSRKKHFVNFQEASGIQLLLSSENEKEIGEIMKMLENKRVSAWVFNPRENSLKNTVSLHLLTKKDISILQKPSEKIEKKFLSETYDLLIDLTTHEILPLKYLLGISVAPCRCGMKKKGYPFYDLEIAAPAKTKGIELLKQILHYLNVIQAK